MSHIQAAEIDFFFQKKKGSTNIQVMILPEFMLEIIV